MARKKADSVTKRASAYNELGFKLLGQLLKKDPGKNILISPVGIAFSLALILNGADGGTKRAISKILKAGKETLEDFNLANQALRLSLEREVSGVQMAWANALWADKGASFDSSFLKTIAHFYGAEAGSLDFASAAAVEAINEWTREQTSGKIPSLIEPADLQQQTSCILVNAVYFKGIWATPFDKSATQEGYFFLQNRRKKPVQLMSQNNPHAYFEDDATQLISLAYGGGGISACFLLPHPRTSLVKFLGGLQPKTWDDLIAKVSKQRVELMLPRFELTYDADLNQTLDKLGIGIAFSPGADFGPMGLPNHFITKFKHKTIAEVNEEGSEAAAATGVMMGRSLFTPPRMVIDRPFFWAIRDNHSSALLFIGAVFDPHEDTSQRS
jgi:serine protease inhibitor